VGAEATATPSNGPGAVDVGDFHVESNTATQEQLTEQFSEELKDDTSEAAKKLGKKGAEKRKAQKEGETEEKEEVEAKPKEESEEAKGAEETEKVEPETEPEEKAASEEESEDESLPEKEKLGKPKHDPRARVQQAVAQKNAAERERDEALAAVNELRSRLERLEKGEPPEPRTAPPPGRQAAQKPKAEDFDDYEAYLDARDEYREARLVERFQEHEAQRSQATEADRALGYAINRYSEAVRDTAGDWSEDVQSLVAEFQLPEGATPDASNWMANELVFNPEAAPSLGLYLSEHPDEFQAIASLSTPRDVSRAMAKLEARLELATTGTRPERVAKSKAAPPIKPVSGAPFVGEGEPGPKPGESFDSWYARTKPGKP